MKCVSCGASIQQKPVFRSGSIGNDPRWMCMDCLPEEKKQKLDPETIELVNIIHSKRYLNSPAMKNDLTRAEQEFLAMRDKQNQYFAKRDRDSLNQSKAAESRVDLYLRYRQDGKTEEEAWAMIDRPKPSANQSVISF